MGTQIPKGLGIGVMVVGVPLILWHASNAQTELEALDSTDNRQALCVERTMDIPIPDHKRADVCRCVVTEAQARGLTKRFGGYDQKALEPVVGACLQVHVNQ